MTDVQAAREALEEWIKDAQERQRLQYGAVRRDRLNHMARSAAQITPSEVTQQVPMLAPYAEEIVHVLREAAGVPTSAHEARRAAEPAPPTPATPGVHELNLTFASYAGGIPGEALESATAALDDSGALTYEWPAADAAGGAALYRVVTSDTTRPLSPEDGRVAGTTTSTSISDPRRHVGVNRHVQVWVNTGEDPAAAAAGQPVLWAETTVGAPVTEPVATWDHGAVVTRWRTVEGVERVRVFRLPREIHESVLAHELDQYAVQPSGDHKVGIVDTDVTRGKEYVYRIITESRGTWSPPVDLPITPPHDARGVEDLTATILHRPTGEAPGSVTLEWTQPPSGQVAMYRSEGSPPAGLVGKVVSRAVLDGAGLDPLPNPAEPTGAPGAFRMSHVRWPQGWTSAYFLPVTLMGDSVLPGQAVRVTGVPVPTDPELAHRGDVQVVSFGWPAGAGTVRVHLAPRNADPAAVIKSRPHLEVDRERYIRDGGIRLALPPAQAVDVVLTAWVTGETSSEPVVVRVDPRLTISYTMEPQRRLGLGSVRHGKVVVWSTQEGLRGSPQFVVVHNPDRLPLHAEDGEALAIVPDEAPDTPPQRVIAPVSLSGGPQGAAYRATAPKQSKGYVRLFVAPQVSEQVRRRIIILDPPVGSLIWK